MKDKQYTLDGVVWKWMLWIFLYFSRHACCRVLSKPFFENWIVGSTERKTANWFLFNYNCYGVLFFCCKKLFSQNTNPLYLSEICLSLQMRDCFSCWSTCCLRKKQQQNSCNGLQHNTLSNTVALASSSIRTQPIIQCLGQEFILTTGIFQKLLLNVVLYGWLTEIQGRPIIRQ